MFQLRRSKINLADNIRFAVGDEQIRAVRDDSRRLRERRFRQSAVVTRFRAAARKRRDRIFCFKSISKSGACQPSQ
jgi:hypothetical protein